MNLRKGQAMAAGDKTTLPNDGVTLFEQADGSKAMQTVPVSSVVAGAAYLSTGKVTAGAAGTLVVARPTRRSLIVTNTDASLDVYICAATVSATTGYLLQAGRSVPLAWTGLIQVFAASGSPVVTYWDEYD